MRKLRTVLIVSAVLCSVAVFSPAAVLAATAQNQHTALSFGQQITSFFSLLTHLFEGNQAVVLQHPLIEVSPLPVSHAPSFSPMPSPTSEHIPSTHVLGMKTNGGSVLSAFEFSQHAPLTVRILDTAGVNLLRNSSFEAGGTGAFPPQWNAQFGSNSTNTFISPESARSGSYSLKFVGGGNGNFGLSQPSAKTVPQRTYTLSAYIKVVNIPGATFRLGFWDENNNREGMFKNISFAAGTKDWSRISMTVTTPGLISDAKNWYPMFQVQGLRSGSVYLDDGQLTEGAVLTTYNSALASASSNSLTLGDGSVLVSNGGDIFPAQSAVGQLGTSGNKWNALNLNKATIDSSGNITISGNETIGGLSTGILHANSSGVVTSSAVALNSADVTSTLGVGNGGTGTASTPTNGQLLIGNGTGFTLSTVTAGSGISVTNSAGAITIASTGGSTAFSGVTTGTNTSATMTVGTGAALTFSGTGTVNANQLNGQTTSVGGALTTASSFTTSGANALTLTTTGATNVTLPAAGTLSTLAGTETLTNKTVNGLTLTSAADGFTVAGGTTSRTLTVTGANITVGSTVQPTVAGTLAVQSNGANALTLDTGGVAAVNIGATNANAVTLGANTTISANKSLTLTSGTGTIAQNYANTTGAASTFAVTNSNTGAGTSVNGLAVNLVGSVPSSGTNTNTGINFGNVTGVASNIFNAITFGTGYTNFVTSPNINISSTGVISGAGSYNGVSLGSTTVQPVSAGAFTFQSNGANAVTLDAGGAAGVNVGTTNATSIALGANTTVSANKSLTLSSGTGQISQSYTNTVAGNASVYNVTNGNTGVTATTVSGLDLTLTNATNTNNSNTLNGITLEAASNNNTNIINGINFASATGYTNFIKTPSIVISSAGGISGAGTIASSVTNANALAIGQAGTSNPALNVDTSTASSVTGLNIKSAAATGGLAVSVISSGTNENLTLNAKGTGTVTINNTATGGITLGQATTVTTGGLAVSAGGAAITGASSVNGNLTLGPATSHVISSQTTAPTVAIGAAAGTGAAPSLASASDTKGALTVNVTTGTATGVLATVTFNVTYASPPIVIIAPANAAAAGLTTQIPFVGSTATTFTLNANGVAVPNGTYVWNYAVIQ